MEKYIRFYDFIKDEWESNIIELNSILEKNFKIFEVSPPPSSFINNLFSFYRENEIDFRTFLKFLKDWRKVYIELSKSFELYEDEVEIYKDFIRESFDLIELDFSAEWQKKYEIINLLERKRVEEEKVKFENQLRQAQKMQAIGTLAGGIAHDFNNVLASIVGYTELVVCDISPKSENSFHLQKILKGCHRAKEMIKQILAFSRKVPKKPVFLRISPVIEEALQLLKSSLPANILIKENIRAKSSVILADPTEIHQILMNLCANAAHSMRISGGILEVGLFKLEIGEKEQLFYKSLRPGSYIKLIVKDTGKGMDGKTMERIFEPYFTTKKLGEGTGMGLALVHGIIKSYGGEITVDSTPGMGSTFCIYLPRIKTAVNPQIEERQMVFRGTESILIIDDEEELVYVIKRNLEKAGYKVTAITDSIKAFELFKKKPEKFDLVITDQTMPDMTGIKLAEKILDIRADIPIILCTGYSDTISKEEASIIGFKEFILKPVKIKRLTEIVRNVLDNN